MQIPQIRMESTFIKLGLDIEKPNQQIEQPQAVQMIEQHTASAIDVRQGPRLCLGQLVLRTHMLCIPIV